MTNVIEADWAMQKATRIIKGYRIIGGKGRELREDIAKALRKVESETRRQFNNEPEPVQEPVAPIEAPKLLADRIKTTEARTYGGWVSFEAEGFDSYEEAQSWAIRWEQNNFGYTPIATPTIRSDNTFVVYCKRWHSCD